MPEDGDAGHRRHAIPPLRWQRSCEPAGGGTVIIRNNPEFDWERYGSEDPYYSILNTEAYRRHRLDDSAIEEIFASGENAVRGFLQTAEYHFGSTPRATALEFGCGVGRLLLPLSKRFDHVTGVDVSASMLREAEIHCRRTHAINVRLVRSGHDLSGVTGTFDFVLSFLVLQHVPVRRGEAAIRQLLRHLSPGGVAALHFTTGRDSARLRHVIHVLRRNFVPLHWIANLLSGMRWNEPLMQTNLYRLARILTIAGDEGIERFETTPTLYGDHVGVMLYLHRARNSR